MIADQTFRAWHKVYIFLSYRYGYGLRQKADLSGPNIWLRLKVQHCDELNLIYEAKSEIIPNFCFQKLKVFMDIISWYMVLIDFFTIRGHP